jgi:hypothetical protein
MSTALDVAIGLFFLYLLLALSVTTVQELVATAFAWRAKNLYAAVSDMLKNGSASPLTKEVYAHPLVRNLVQKELGRLPSYIPSKTFAIALLDVLQRKTSVTSAIGADRALEGAKQLVSELPDDSISKDLKRTLLLLIGDAERYEQNIDRQAAKFSECIEAWFNDRMARAAGWYKRQAQYVSLGLAAAVTVCFNADSIKVAGQLWTNASLRAAVVASAEAARDGAASSLVESNLPLGWGAGFPQAIGGWTTPFGWTLTALAVSLGSSFWFDALSRVLRLRGTGGKISAADGKLQTANN